MYILNILEAISQLLNTIHGGNPNQTFSKRCHGIREGSQDYWVLPIWYWNIWLWGFKTLWPGHLDWASSED
jgi:hypothetical protein